MKRIVLWTIMVVIAVLSFAQPLANVYILDESGAPTNVRNAPNGTVIKQLPDVDGGYVVALLGVKDGWWKIDPLIDIYGSDIEDDYTLLEGSEAGYWVHYSVLALGINGDPKNVLREKPSVKSKPLNVGVSYLAQTALRPLEIKGKWIKVVTTDKRHTGWMPLDRICYNPLTTCP